MENPPTSSPNTSPQGIFAEIIRFLILSIVIVVPIRIFIAQPFIVKGESMHPTFEDGEYLIVDEITYYRKEPERGDVIIFKYPKDPSKYYIKRIIGLPGETVSISQGVITITSRENPIGKTLDEPYIKNIAYDNATASLGEGEYFVMGDNRTNSSDSRSWGVLPREDIVGRALVRLFPLSEVSLFPGKHDE